MPGIEEQIRRQRRARGYDAATVAAVSTGGLPTAVYRVAVWGDPGPGSQRLQGTAAELRFGIARLPPAPRVPLTPRRQRPGGVRTPRKLGDAARERAAREAHELYRRLRRLARTLPEGHPACPALAAEAAQGH